MTERIDHLDAAAIAALVDRTLDPAARAAVEAHLAECADCREVWVETSEMAGDMTGATSTGAVTPPANVVAHRPRSRRWMYAGAAIAASVIAAVGLWYRISSSSLDNSIANLQPASATHRFTDGRLSAALPWLPPPAITRGAEPRLHPEVLEASARLRAMAEERESPRLLQAAAIGLLATGDREEAIEILTRAAQLAPEDASIRGDLSAAYLEVWRFSSQATHAGRALDEAKRATMLDPANAGAVFNLALSFEAFGLEDEAQRTWKQYLALDASSAWADEARRRLSGSSRQEDESLSYLYADLETHRLPQWADDPVEANGHRVLLDAARILNDGGDGALRDGVRAAINAAAWTSVKRACLADAFRHIATWTAAFEGGQSQRALSAAEAAATSFRCAGLSTVDADSRRSVSLLELSRLSEADAVAAAVLNAQPPHGYRRARARAWQIRGLVAYQEARLGDALESARLAADEAAAARDLEFHAALHTNIADLLSSQGDIAGAWRHLAIALDGVRTIRSARRKYSILARASISALEVQWPGAALAFSDAVIRSSTEWANPVGRAFGYLKRAEALAGLGRSDLVPANIEFAQALAQGVEPRAVRNELDAQARTTRALLTSATNTTPGTELDAALAHFEATGNRIMQAPVLLARGRVKAAAKDFSGAERDWRSALTIVEDERPEIRDTQLQISRLHRVWELYEELIGLLVDRDPAAALEISERGRGRQLLDSLSPTQTTRAPLSGSNMTSWLPHDATALVYAVLPDRLIIWHASSSRFDVLIRNVSRSELERLIDGHLIALQAGTRSPSIDTLSTLLLPERLTHSSILLLMPDGPLHRLPFSSLKRDGRTPDIASAAIVVAPSLTAAHAASARPPQGTLVPLLVGSGLAARDSRLPRLNGVAAEIASVKSVYQTARVLLDDDAEPSAVLTRMREHPVFHFAGHAIVDTLHPRRSRLVMSSTARERALSAADISGARLRPGTVVILAGCETANGEIYRGEGVMALSRAFVQAGATAVVGTLWRLQDQDSAEFLTDFHRAFLQSRSAAHALAATQRVWASNGRPASVWAAFQVTGGLSNIGEGQ